MPAVNLSYIIATYNRLPFLKITLEKLIGELQPDEEIVVVDGNSMDGTQDYLQQLFKAGQIKGFISETDKNQAHAWNKAMLMANGIIIKKIIDDDVFCYQAIRNCKTYMLEHSQVDVIISNDLSSALLDSQIIDKHTRLPQFEKWRAGVVPSFTFRDVNILIRRDSLSYIGLYNPSFTMMDWEYSLRISYLQANIVYFTGYTALTVGHPQTVTSLVSKQQLIDEGKRGKAFYNYIDDHISNWSKLKIAVGKILYAKKQTFTEIKDVDLLNVYTHYYDYIDNLCCKGCQFLT